MGQVLTRLVSVLGPCRHGTRTDSPDGLLLSPELEPCSPPAPRLPRLPGNVLSLAPPGTGGVQGGCGQEGGVGGAWGSGVPSAGVPGDPSESCLGCVGSAGLGACCGPPTAAAEEADRPTDRPTTAFREACGSRSQGWAVGRPSSAWAARLSVGRRGERGPSVSCPVLPLLEASAARR